MQSQNVYSGALSLLCSVAAAARMRTCTNNNKYSMCTYAV